MKVQFEFTWIEPSVVVSRTSGLASAEGFAALYLELASQPEFGPGVKVLSDQRSLDVSKLTAVDIERIADTRLSVAGTTGMRSAIVVGPAAPVKYGLARMFGAYTSARGGDLVRVFETIDEAMAWLQSQDSPVSPEYTGATGAWAP